MGLSRNTKDAIRKRHARNISSRNTSRKISITDGLVNGAMGIVKGFKWPALRRDQQLVKLDKLLEVGELPDAILVQFDDPTVGVRAQGDDGYVSIAPVTATYQGNRGYGDIERRMLPVILSWAVTVHKLQGCTLTAAVIDLGKKILAKGQAYVALSRVKNLQGMALCDIDAHKLLKNPHDNRALSEMTRMRNLS